MFIPLLHLDKRNGSECILMVASVSKGWDAAECVQSYLLSGGRKRISTILIFQNRTGVNVQILIGFDFRDLFLERAFSICMIIAILSVEQRKKNTTQHLTLSPSIPVQFILQTIQQIPSPPSSLLSRTHLS